MIHHSDRGGEYTSRDLELALRGFGALASMGSVADCYDNSMAEAFFATLETELFWAQPHRRSDTHREAKLAIFDYIGSSTSGSAGTPRSAASRRSRSKPGTPNGSVWQHDLRNSVSTEVGQLQLAASFLTTGRLVSPIWPAFSGANGAARIGI